MQEEKVAIVTGSSTGIGFETSLAFTRSGFLPMPQCAKVEESTQITEIARNDSLPLQVMQVDVNNDEICY